MDNLVNAFLRLKNESSTLKKKDILLEYKDDELFLYCLEFLLNKDKTTGISKSKLKKKIDTEPIKKITDLKEMIEYLLENNTGRDIDIAELKYFLNYKTDEVVYPNDVIVELLLKSLRLGVTSKTANKVYGNSFITDFEIMHLHSYEGKDKEYFDNKATLNGFSIELKENGVHCIIIKNGDNLAIKTRQGKDIKGLVELEPIFRQFKEDGVYEGELLAHQFEEEVWIDSNDQFNKTKTILSTNGNKTGLYITMFDYLPLEDFYNKESELTHRERRDMLESNCGYTEYGFIDYAEILYRGTEVSKIEEFLSNEDKNGSEGLVVKLLDSKYEFKRTKNQLKVKSFCSFDLPIVDFKEGQGENEGTLGAIIVDYKGEQVGVGSGLTKEMRNEIWDNRELYLGRVVEVKCKGESRDENGKLSLQYPIFICVREEGKEVSYS